MDLFVAQLLLKHKYSGYKGGSFRQMRSGVMLQPTNDAWESAGGMLGNTGVTASVTPMRSIGQYPGKALSRSNAMPAFIAAAKIAIVSQTRSGHRNAESLVRREGERNCLSVWSFFPHLELFQQMLIKF